MPTKALQPAAQEDEAANAGRLSGSPDPGNNDPIGAANHAGGEAPLGARSGHSPARPEGRELECAVLAQLAAGDAVWGWRVAPKAHGGNKS